MDVKGKKIFLSYSYCDRDIANQVCDELRKQGCNVFWDEDILPGQKWTDIIQENIKSSDLVVIILSNSYLRDDSNLKFTDQLTYHCKRRDINAFCLKIDNDHIPELNKRIEVFSERDIKIFDFTKRANLETLINSIKAVGEVSFENLSWKEFENLIFELLVRRGFKNIQKNPVLFGRQFDFVADSEFGSETKSWVVECKFYQNNRFTVSALNEVIRSVSALPINNRNLLLITNSQFTSASVEFIYQAQKKFKVNLQLLDGFQLKNFISTEPDLIRKFFTA